MTFCDQGGAPLVWLHPLDSVGVNGAHALVIASTLVRVEMLRVGHTYDLFITQHAPGFLITETPTTGKTRFCFSAHEGYLAALDLVKENGEPERIGRAGISLTVREVLTMPVEFEAVVKAITGAAGKAGGRHSADYLQAPGQDDEDRIEAKVSEVRA